VVSLPLSLEVNRPQQALTPPPKKQTSVINTNINIPSQRIVFFLEFKLHRSIRHSLWRFLIYLFLPIPLIKVSIHRYPLVSSPTLTATANA
jgi:hypothetical protein